MSFSRLAPSARWIRWLLNAQILIHGLIALLIVVLVSGAVTTTETAMGLAGIFVMLQILAPLVLVTCGVIWLVWQRRAHANLRDAFLEQGLRYRRGWWPILAWLIPFVNLVVPYRAIKELVTRSGRDASAASSVSLGAWWGFFLIAGVFQPVGPVQTDDPAQVAGFLVVRAVGAMLYLGAAIYAKRIVAFVTRTQSAWALAIATGENTEA